MKSIGNGHGLLLVLACAGCSTNPAVAPPAPPATISAPATADYGALAARPGARIFAIDSSASRLRIYVYRGGRAAFAGHDHVLTAQDFSGHVYLPDKITESCFDLAFPLERLIVDDPVLREETGGVFAGALDADAIEGTRDHMLGPDNLDAAHYPLLLVHSDHIVGDLPRLVASVLITLHGQTRTMLVPIEVRLDGDRLHARGAIALRQTDFGVRPYAVLGGLLSVQDEISIVFDLVGTAPGG